MTAGTQLRSGLLSEGEAEAPWPSALQALESPSASPAPHRAWEAASSLATEPLWRVMAVTQGRGTLWRHLCMLCAQEGF